MMIKVESPILWPAQQPGEIPALFGETMRRYEILIHKSHIEERLTSRNSAPTGTKSETVCTFQSWKANKMGREFSPHFYSSS